MPRAFAGTLQKPGKFSVMDLGFAADAQAALDSAEPELAGVQRPSSLPAPVDRLMSLIFDIEMMHQVLLDYVCSPCPIIIEGSCLGALGTNSMKQVACLYRS